MNNSFTLDNSIMILQNILKYLRVLLKHLQLSNEWGGRIPPKILLGLIHEFSKFAGYKTNIWKSVVLLYTNNELPERAMKKTTPFTIASKRIKYLGINLTEEAKDLSSEN